MSISDNQVVSIHYELRNVDNGEILDSNINAAPLSFIVGKGQIIPGLEEKIKDLKVGEKADIKVAAVDAYGVYDDNAVQTLPKEQFAGLELQVGMTLYGQGEHGETVQVIVKNFNDETVEIDFNHPLAGKDLLFAINVVEVRDATADEILNGYVGGGHGGCGCGSGGSCHTTDSDDDECCGGHGHDHAHGEGGCCGGEGHSHGGGCCGSH
ncbi:MAG: peptidylprolyl isomerase [Sulfurospirillum sp.]|jgi:FKBP-type peptidyl-prolyl cis-trans isomerase SlyD|uniref:FKBP-type peptidyl-prolyl cis-trans isomerase n=1 Tax=Sulfurospirillum sp. UCH001 TaxID=1581011 RepID=UPI000829E34F|nr:MULTISPECIES: peptidylprolyl isomerase [unclassified Sulfurospirillum]WNY98184.1 FKBP-type peptidyl-prolyl cis-trans isomerase SlyD (PPIase) (Metallochaperone SlyD) [Sulfurospirillum sp. 'SP']